MNKKITKVAALSVGLAMAIGVGVALGSKGARAAKASAIYSAYKLDGSTADESEGSSNGYATESTITQGGVEWGVVGNTKMGPWRIGGKKINAADRLIQSKAVVTSQDVDYVELEVGTNSLTTVALSLKVGTTVGGSETDTISATFAPSSTITFSKPDGHNWASKYFTLVCTCTYTPDSNKFFQFKGLDFKYEVSVLEPDNIEVSGESEVTVGGTTTLSALCKKGTESEGVNQNVTWESSNTAVAVVNSNGVVTGVSNGNATITAKGESSPSVSGSKVVTVSGGKADNLALVVSPDVLPGSYGDNYLAISGVYMHVNQVMKNDGVIQIKNEVGLLENVAALPFDISKIEISFNAAKAQGTGFAIKASTDGETYIALEGEQIYTNRFAYSAPSTGYRYFQIVGPEKNKGTLYLDEVLVSLGNESEADVVALAAALNDLLDEECQGAGDSSKISEAKWAEIEAAYNASEDAAAKASLKTITGASYIEVNQFLSRYDHIVGGYGYTNFLNREVPASRYAANSVFENNNSVMIIVITIASVSALAFTTLLLLKKKKQK